MTGRLLGYLYEGLVFTAAYVVLRYGVDYYNSKNPGNKMVVAALTPDNSMGLGLLLVAGFLSSAFMETTGWNFDKVKGMV